MSESITPWLHILAITVWIGPQFFLFLAAIPAIRTIEDAQVRAQTLRTIVTRFGWIAWGAMAVIILTGISNLFQTGSDAPFSLWDSDYRWFRIFAEKMTLVGLAVALTVVHTFWVGPQQLRLAEQLDADPAAVRNARRLSIAISAAGLLASIGALYLGVVLADHEYTFVVD
jgi:uncharacterized membrane protein